MENLNKYERIEKGSLSKFREIIPCIYCIYNRDTDSKDILKRIYQHNYGITHNRHHNLNIQELYNNGNIKLEYYIVERVENQNNLILKLEQIEQTYLDSNEYNLNITKVSNLKQCNQSYEERFGKEKAKQTKEKIRISNSSRIITQETKDKISDSLKEFNKDREIGTELRYKYGNATRGKKRPEVGEKIKITWIEKKKEIGKKYRITNLLTEEINIYDDYKIACSKSNICPYSLYKSINFNKPVKNLLVEIIYGES